MIPIYLFVIALVFTIVQLAKNGDWHARTVAETSLLYILFFNVGIMGLIAFFGHVFYADEIAKSIGWPTGSPFQFEMGMTNLAFGVLGVLCLRYRGLFWNATVIGSSILYLGCVVGHFIQYSKGDVAPYNIGPGIIFNDLVVPLILLSLLAFLRLKKHHEA